MVKQLAEACAHLIILMLHYQNLQISVLLRGWVRPPQGDAWQKASWHQLVLDQPQGHLALAVLENRG